MRIKRALLATLAITLAIALGLGPEPSEDPVLSPIDPLDELSDCSQYGTTRSEAELSDPLAEHGAHPNSCTEIWYVTGHLRSPDQRLFGFQLSIIRAALGPQPPALDSAWATHQAYRAQLALSDAQAQRFHVFERYSRGALGLAGATPAGETEQPPQVWVENWRISFADRFHLVAEAEEIGLELRLSPAKPAVDGAAGEAASAAFTAYMLSRLEVRGTLRIAERKLPVSGSAWLNRAWGAVPLGSTGQQAVNRFALQLDDGRDLSLLQLRRRDGSGIPVTSGVLVDSAGKVRRLRRRELSLETLNSWQSQNGVSYPARWRLRIPGQGLDLEIVPLIPDQELRLALRYWSGTVRVQGPSASGVGHAELTGYASDRF